jgi:hypothetical protein
MIRIVDPSTAASFFPLGMGFIARIHSRPRVRHAQK